MDRGSVPGILLGLATTIKLTPAAFILFFLLRKDWRSTIHAAASSTTVTLLGFLLDWHDSANYWTKMACQTGDRIGLGYIGNESITPTLTRLGLTSPVSTLAWLVLVIGLAALAILAMRRALAARQWLLALSINGMLELLASPISWSHHWVWVFPLMLSLAALSFWARAWLPLVLAGASLLLFTLVQQWTMHHLGRPAQTFIPDGARLRV